MQKGPITSVEQVFKIISPDWAARYGVRSKWARKMRSGGTEISYLSLAVNMAGQSEQGSLSVSFANVDQSACNSETMRIMRKNAFVLNA